MKENERLPDLPSEYRGVSQKLKARLDNVVAEIILGLVADKDAKQMHLERTLTLLAGPEFLEAVKAEFISGKHSAAAAGGADYTRTP